MRAQTNLPTGTVTFLFSDIEGSTRLVQRLGDRYPGVLETHQRLLMDAFAEHDGVVVGTEGDSFFVAFPSAPRAVSAAVRAQRSLSTYPWPPEAEVRVRMGIHTGEAVLAGGSYTGVDVHRAARIAASGHGGQVLLSETTRALVGDALPGGADLRDLGEHRLKDLLRPERIYQVVHPDLAADFPPLATLTRRPNNLPMQTSAFLGRETELAALQDLLDGPVRLVTLTGPGGIGKTRLALQAAAELVDRFEDGAFFVDLAPLHDPGAVLDTIAQALGLARAPQKRALEAIIEELAPRHALLLLDNFEQVVEAAGDVAQLLQACPHVKALVTTREALRIRGETLFPVSPLAVPPPDVRGSATWVAEYEAVRLFVERAREARPDFALTDADAEAVAEICVRLDGLPLALELAAARLSLFSPGELRDRLHPHLEVLGSGARDLPARQRTLRSTIGWSYDLLDDEERTVFAMLSVFAGATVAAVEDVAGRAREAGDVPVVATVASLVDKSLVRAVEGPGGRRLAMLQTIREFAAERLASDGALRAATRAAHAELYTDLALTARERLEGGDRDLALADLTADEGNLASAWAFWIEAGDVRKLEQLLEPLWVLYEARGWYDRAVEMARQLLDSLSSLPEGRDRSRQTIAVATSLARGLLALRGYTAEVDEAYRRVLAMLDEVDGLPRLFPVLRSLASYHLYRGEFDKGAVVGRELLALAEQQKDERVQVEGHLVLGSNLANTGEVSTGLEHLERAIALFDPDRHGPAALRLGPSPGVVPYTASALFLWLLGHPERATARASDGLALAERLDHPFTLAYALFHVGYLDLWRGRVDLVEERAISALRVAEEHRYDVWRALAMMLQGVAAAALGRPEDGVALSDSGVDMYRGLAAPPVFWPLLLLMRGRTFAYAGRFDEAIEPVDSVIGMYGGQEDLMYPDALLLKGDVFQAASGADAAEPLFRRALEVAGRGGSRMYELRAATRLAQLRADVEPDVLERLRRAYERFAEGFDEPDLVEARAILARGSIGSAPTPRGREI